MKVEHSLRYTPESGENTKDNTTHNSCYVNYALNYVNTTICEYLPNVRYLYEEFVSFCKSHWPQDCYKRGIGKLLSLQLWQLNLVPWARYASLKHAQIWICVYNVVEYAAKKLRSTSLIYSMWQKPIKRFSGNESNVTRLLEIWDLLSSDIFYLKENGAKFPALVRLISTLMLTALAINRCLKVI